MKRIGQIFNAAPGTTKSGRAASPFCAITNLTEADKPLEILIYDDIGKSDWTGEGFDAKDFVAQLKGVDENRELNIRLNSRGGVVDDGIAIYNRIREWKGKTVAIIDGAAASIASVIAMGAKEVRMPKSAQILIHEAHGLAFGTKDDMEEMANRLENASNRIAGIYSERTGKPVAEMRDYMRKTSVFDGEQSKTIGFADVLTDESPLYNLSAEDIENFRQPPAKTKTKPAAKSGEQEPPMNKEKIIAAIKKLGGTVADDATDQQLVAQLETLIEAKATTTKKEEDKKEPEVTAKEILDIRAELKKEREARESERKIRISAEIDKLIASSQLPGAQREKAIARAIADETILDEYRALPSMPPGVEPTVNLEITGEDPKQIEKAVLQNFGGKPGLSAAQARERGLARAKIINANFKKLLPLLNINTVATDLKRTVILQQMIRAFAIRVLPLQAFSTVFNGVRLEGTDKIAVPYFPLHTTASTDFVAANGYDTFQDTNSDAKVITVDKRKYQALRWTSVELSRQPYLEPAMNAMLQAEQLGIDVVNDVLSLVLAATFTETAYAQPAAAFDSQDVAELKGAADLLNWPAAGRSLIINSAYDVNMLKDTAITNALAFGDNSPIREGRIQRIVGFDYIPDGRVPTNAENLQGMIVFKSALLVGFAPVEPTAEVRQQLSSYEEVTDPETGATFSYRRWGNPDLDQSREAIEAAYGRIAGEVKALKRITT